MVQLDYIIILKMFRNVDMMACLGKLPQQWIVLGKKEYLCMLVLQEGNIKKGSGRCGHGGFVVTH